MSFARPRTELRVFHKSDGTTRPVIVIYGGTAKVLTIEIHHARALADQIHDLAEKHELYGIQETGANR